MAAVVLTVSVPGVPGVVDPEQVGPSVTAGETEQLRVTLPVKPFVLAAVTVEVDEPPGLTEDGDNVVAVRVKFRLAACVYLAMKASWLPLLVA